MWCGKIGRLERGELSPRAIDAVALAWRVRYRGGVRRPHVTGEPRHIPEFPQYGKP